MQVNLETVILDVYIEVTFSDMELYKRISSFVEEVRYIWYKI